MESKAAEREEWMLAEVKERGILRQEEVVQFIADHYGEKYLYMNDHGNRSLDKEVKKLFKKLHRGKAAWDRDGFFWGWT